MIVQKGFVHNYSPEAKYLSSSVSLHLYNYPLLLSTISMSCQPSLVKVGQCGVRHTCPTCHIIEVRKAFHSLTSSFTCSVSKKHIEAAQGKNSMLSWNTRRIIVFLL